ncbi:hypothetical protein NJL88_41675, partial [Streptomyces sp. DK15]|uniref:NAD(P)-dependent oxidoreductase n=1 Tax=Streptomyces sp. DK15 TaxID=2957499 RepID=UPI0029B0E737
DVEYAKKKGIYIINTPFSSSKSVAELVFAHFFTISRFLHDSNRKIPLIKKSKLYELKKEYTMATELSGKILGVVGFGSIGIEKIKIVISLGMNILIYDPFVKKSKTITLTFFNKKQLDFNLKTSSFKDVIKNSDYISLHVPKQEKYLIGKKEFSLMKDG